MGLPMFREPEVIQAKAVLKSDLPAAARSTIRRHRTIRSPRHRPTSSSVRLASGSDTSRLLGRRSLGDFVRREADSGDHERRTPAHIESAAELARLEAANRQRLMAGRALLRDALSYERPSRRLRDYHTDLDDLNIPDFHGLPNLADISGSELIPEGGQGDDETPSQSQLSLPPMRRGTSSHPFQLTSIFGPLSPRPAGESDPLTPGFAPAYRFGDGDGLVTRPGSSDAASRLSTVPRYTPSADLDGFPALRRVGRRRVSRVHLPRHPENAPSRSRSRTDLDGLGDRERSFSPDDDSPWETLLTTITPDHQLPSHQSSFTSASAAASASSGTTAPTSVSDLFDPLIVCDATSDSDTSESEVGNRDRPDMPPRRRPELYSAAVRARARESERGIRHFFSNIDQQRAERIEDDLHAGVILDDESGDGIPDDWWAAVGLTREIRDDQPRNREREQS